MLELKQKTIKIGNTDIKISTTINQESGYELDFIFEKDAKKFITENKNYGIYNKYNKKHKNYGQKFLGKITKDKNGEVVDFMYVIPSKKDEEELRKKGLIQ
jgi:hypothetical protein